MKDQIVVMGSINMDLVVVVAKAPEAGETIAGESFQMFPGGKGANQAVAAARLVPGSVSLFGLLGKDVFAPMLLDSLQHANVDTSNVISCEGPSGVAHITVEGSAQNRIVVIAGANGGVTQEVVDEQASLLARARVLLLQLETPLSGVMHAARLAHDQGAIVILDPAPAQPLPASLLQCVTWLTPNYTEACLLTGRSPSDDPLRDAGVLLDELLQMGSQNILLKLGEHGAFIALRSGERQQITAFRVDAVDTTAAGDAFNAGFAVALLRGLDSITAARYASAVAAVSVTRWGAQPSMPSQDEVAAFLQKHGLSIPLSGEVHA